MKSIAAVGGLALLFQSPIANAAPHSLDHSLRLEDVEIRPGIVADIQVAVFENERSRGCRSGGRAGLALPGIGFTAASWEPLAEALFDERRTRAPYCRLYALDLAGHGESGLPEGMLFGDLTLDDLLANYRNTWQRLNETGARPETVFGHSRGALLTQMLQQQLLEEGSSLREEFGAREAVLLGASPPAAIAWSAVTPELFALISGFVTSSPERGVFAQAPPEVWVAVSYTNFAGVPHPDTPFADLPRFTTAESIPSVLATFGFAPFARPEVDPGLFAPSLGTRLELITGTQDGFALVAEQEQLYQYLTGDCSFGSLEVVEDEFAVHNLYNAEPELLTLALAREGKKRRKE